MGKQFLFLLLILLMGDVSAQYIVGDIYITENGRVIFSVDTDVDLDLKGLNFDGEKIRGETRLLANMNQGIWSFDLDFGYYETILLDIHLPKNIERVNSIEGVTSIVDFNERIISLIDEDKNLSFRVEYEVSQDSSSTFLYVVFIIILSLLVIFLFFKSKKSKKKKLKEIFPLISDREREVVELLMKGQMRQKEIRKKLNIPKASYSRYLVNLEKKKLIMREGEGKNKIVRLK